MQIEDMMMPLFIRCGVFASLVCLALACTLSASASGAATITVTSLADDGGAGELGAAITAANASPGSTITFASGINGTITLTSALPTITAGMTIQGAYVIAVDGAAEYRPFYINAPGASVTISGLTIRNGSDEADNLGGAGIYMEAGSLTLVDCTLGGNGANGIHTLYQNGTGVGGGIFNNGTASLTNCALVGNCAELSGGGIYNGGALELTNCTLAGNFTSAAPDPFYKPGVGGGIENVGSATLTNCTLSENIALDVGGGIDNGRQVEQFFHVRRPLGPDLGFAHLALNGRSQTR